MNRRLRSLLAVVALLVLAALPILSRPAAAATVEITVWHCWGGKEAEFFQKTIDDFNKSQTAIKVRGVPQSAKAEKVIAAITGGNPPDAVVMCNQAQVPGWAEQGAIQPLDDMIKAQHIDLSDVIPTALQWVTYKGKLYGLPFLQDNYGLYWNKQLFREAGLDPNRPPQTLEELDQYAEKLTKRDASGRITQIGYIPNWPGDKFDMYAKLFGCQLYDAATNKITGNGPQCVKMLEWIKSYYTKYGGPNGQGLFDFISGLGNYDSAQNPFFTGTVAMMWDGEWIPGPAYVAGYVPNLDYGTGPMPAPADHKENTGATVMSGNPFLIPKGAAHTAEALTFGAWLMTPAPTKTMAIALSSVPQLKSLLNDPAFQDPHFKTFLELANGPNAFAPLMLPIWPFYNDTYLQQQDEVLHGRKDAKQALDDMVATVQKELDTNGS